MERRLSAIFAADMVGYSRLMEADEVGTIERQKAHRAELINPTFEEFHGRIVKAANRIYSSIQRVCSARSRARRQTTGNREKQENKTTGGITMTFIPALPNSLVLAV